MFLKTRTKRVRVNSIRGQAPDSEGGSDFEGVGGI